MPRKEHGYNGVLAEPISVEILTKNKYEEITDNDSNYTEYCEFMHDNMAHAAANKLPALFEHYNIDPAEKNCWMQLTIRLAANHVKGFKFEKSPKGGRPLKWTREKLWLLFCEVRHKMDADPCLTEEKACEAISLKNSQNKHSAKALQNRLAEAKKSNETQFYDELRKEVPKLSIKEFIEAINEKYS